MPAGPSVNTLLTKAAKAAKSRDWATAIDGFQSVLERFPGNKKARAGMVGITAAALPELLSAAQAAERQNAWPEAERHLSLAAALGPIAAEIRLALARCRLELGAVPQALRDVDTMLAQDPENTEALNIKGRALREMGRVKDALACFQSALGGGDHDARTLNNIGLSLRASGDLPAAAEHFRRALSVEPDNPTIHSNLAQVTSYSEDATHLDEMRDSLSRLGTSDPASTPLHFALFKALDELDARDEAFVHLKTGNTLAKAASGYDFKTDAVPYGLSKLLFETAPDTSFESAEPRTVFVTGLPRSGTTLVERMLSQAPKAKACGELTVIQRAVGPLLRDIMGRNTRHLRPDDLSGFRETVLAEFADYADGARVIIDKMPLNFRWIGYICAALPDAGAVHIDRDPMAVAWSLYRHAFVGQGMGFTNDFQDIGRFMVLHADLMAYWRDRFPGRVIDLNYAELVSDPETQTHRLAEALSLEWSPDWLHPEQAGGQILTASAEQARKPIYRNSDAGWKRYETQLAPLAEMLGTAKLI